MCIKFDRLAFVLIQIADSQLMDNVYVIFTHLDCDPQLQVCKNLNSLP